MKIVAAIVLLALLIPSCAPKITSQIVSKQQPLSSNAYILVIPEQTPFTNNAIEIGTIRGGDNGFSTNCSYSEVMKKLKALARQNGANILRVEKIKLADFWSSCDKVTAKIYKVADVRKYETEIEWMAERKLSWTDFKGLAGSMSNPQLSAETSTGIGFVTNRLTIFKKPVIYIRNIFSCKLSWVRPGLQIDADLLGHEQGHFDICEIYARRIRQQLKKESLNKFNLLKKVNKATSF